MKQNSLDSEPFPEPNRSRPISIIGSMAAVPRKIAPKAKIPEPRRQRNENKNTPTENTDQQPYGRFIDQ